MPDIRDCPPPGPTVGEALRALPLERPSASAWPRLAAGLSPRRRHRRPLWALAAAAALVAALALPRLLAPPLPSAAPTLPPPVAASDDSELLPALVQESAVLEAMLAATGSGQVGTGAALLLRGRMQQRIQLVDALLADPALDPQARLPLWQERVLLLRGLAGLEGGEQVLAARGDVAESTLVVTL